MEQTYIYVNRTAVSPSAVACPRPRRGSRPLAEWLEWTALIVLPLTTLLAAVSLLANAVQ
jgi:hypothetical protein